MPAPKLTKKEKIRQAAESDLESFIRLIAPHNVMGSVHSEVVRWWTREDAKRHQLLLLPRDHGKSRYAAFRAAYILTTRPDVRILYLSATSGLAEKQLKFIKDILESDVYRYYWPEMVNKEVSKREKWTNSEICVDHPKRKQEGVRDSTIFTGGLTTSITGLHCDVAILDDIIVAENAQTEEGREKVRRQYSLLASIEGGVSEEWVVGTRYHPLDLYGEMLEMREERYNEEGDVIGSAPIYEVFQRQVESMGDGTGEFLWPRQQRADGVWFGFNRQILATKRGKYLDKTQFSAQYYNNPNDTTDSPVDRSSFQYYDKKYVKHDGGHWYYKGERLNVVASVDFAYSTGSRSDYTAIVVLGIDSERNKYILDIERFRTKKISDYFERIFNLHSKWRFRKLIAEATAAQSAIVEELKYAYIKPQGLLLSIKDVKPTRHQGSKEERLSAILEPSYENQSVWHYRGGNCQTLEEELILRFPPHDDIKDALASAIEHAVPPSAGASRRSNIIPLKGHSRFGGIAG